MYALLLAIIYLAFISLGLPDSLIGAGWPAMHQDLGVPVSYAGIVTMIIAIGTIVSSLLSERLTKRLGTGVVTAVSVGMTAAALLGFSFSTEFWMLLLWAVPYGVGAGAVDAALNNYVALHYSSRHMSWLHGFWGVGASISPFIMGFALAQDRGWSTGYLIVGVLQVAMTAILVVGLPLWKKAAAAKGSRPADHPGPADDPAPAADSAPADHPELAEHSEPAAVETAAPTSALDDAPETAAPALSIKEALNIPGVPLMLAGFLAYCAVEATAILWGATYLVSERSFTAAVAATYASLYLIGITSGRFLSGIIADRVGDRGMIKGGALLMLVGIALIALPGAGGLFTLIGLVVAGLGSAPVYPSIIHSTPANFGKQNSHGIIGIQMASAYVGSTIAPPVFGFVSSVTGMWLLPLYLAVFAVMLLFMTEKLNRLVDERRRLQDQAATGGKR